MNISGTGISSNGVTLSATHLDFGNQAVGTTSAAQALTLANFGTASLMISGVTLAPGDFAQTNTCPVSPATLAIGASCAFNITFTPTTTGLRVSSITVSDNDPGSPRTTTFAGTGTVAPAVSLAPSGLTFPIQMVGSTSSAQTVTLTNTGNATLIDFQSYRERRLQSNKHLRSKCFGRRDLHDQCDVQPHGCGRGGWCGQHCRQRIRQPAYCGAFWHGTGFPDRCCADNGDCDGWANGQLHNRRQRHSRIQWDDRGYLYRCTSELDGTASGGGNSGTPPGTYPLTVTGSYNSGTTTVNHTTMLTLTVR